MIDTHAHLDDKKFITDQIDVIKRAWEQGVKKIINVGADLAGSAASVELAVENENIFAAVGLHPHIFSEIRDSRELSFSNVNAVQEFSSELDDLKKLAQNKKVVAIGEIGLDYFGHNGNVINKEQKENQKKGFVAQIKLAKKLNLPVIIHCRGSKENPNDAYEDLYAIISNPKSQVSSFVFHCYGGGLNFTEKLLELGNVQFSFTGNITYAKNNAEILEVVKIIPLEKIMLETDCPYLTPAPHRGKRNEPAYVMYIGEKIAEIKEISVEKINKATTENAINFFKLG